MDHLNMCSANHNKSNNRVPHDNCAVDKVNIMATGLVRSTDYNNESKSAFAIGTDEHHSITSHEKDDTILRQIDTVGSLPDCAAFEVNENGVLRTIFVPFLSKTLSGAIESQQSASTLMSVTDCRGTSCQTVRQRTTQLHSTTVEQPVEFIDHWQLCHTRIKIREQKPTVRSPVPIAPRPINGTGEASSGVGLDEPIVMTPSSKSSNAVAVKGASPLLSSQYKRPPAVPAMSVEMPLVRRSERLRQLSEKLRSSDYDDFILPKPMDCNKKSSGGMDIVDGIHRKSMRKRLKQQPKQCASMKVNDTAANFEMSETSGQVITSSNSATANNASSRSGSIMECACISSHAQSGSQILSFGPGVYAQNQNIFIAKQQTAVFDPNQTNCSVIFNGNHNDNAMVQPNAFFASNCNILANDQQQPAMIFAQDQNILTSGQSTTVIVQNPNAPLFGQSPPVVVSAQSQTFLATACQPAMASIQHTPFFGLYQNAQVTYAHNQNIPVQSSADAVFVQNPNISQSCNQTSITHQNVIIMPQQQQLLPLVKGTLTTQDCGSLLSPQFVGTACPQYIMLSGSH